MQRREWLKAGGATLAAPLVASILRPIDAIAKTDQVVVMTWGGQWGDAMRDNVDAAYEKATGIKVVQDRGASPVERITKLKVSAPSPDADLFQLADGLVPLAIKQGVAEKINRDSPRMPNLRNMIPAFWNDYWVPQIFSPLGQAHFPEEHCSPATGQSPEVQQPLAATQVVAQAFWPLGQEQAPFWQVSPVICAQSASTQQPPAGEHPLPPAQATKPAFSW